MRPTNKRRGRNQTSNHSERSLLVSQKSRTHAEVRKRVRLERARFARDLHDDLGQVLTALKIGLESVAAAIQRQESNDVILGRLRCLSREVQGAIAGLRTVIMDLCPATLQRFGLADAIELQGLAFQSRTGIACLTRGLRHASRLRGARAKAVYRFIAEALSNVANHAAAHHVVIEIAQQDNRLSFSVRDDGCGVDGARVGRAGFGLAGMHQRARQLGGSLAISALSPHGTLVRLDLPL
jgi:two-component system sensor histidine kinase UhpB